MGRLGFLKLICGRDRSGQFKMDENVLYLSCGEDLDCDNDF